jgi:hypothetical protein
MLPERALPLLTWWLYGALISLLYHIRARSLSPKQATERWCGLRNSRKEPIVKRSLGACGLAALLLFAPSACAQELTPEQQQTIAGVKEDLKRTNKEVDQATQDDAKYSGGLIKALIGVRIQILKTNAALLEQRIHALEGGARQKVVVNVTKTDPMRADELVREIAAQEQKVAEARREADRYRGGLVQALSESSVATARNTLAMLEQQYFIAKYGFALPAPPAEAMRNSPGNAAATARSAPGEAPRSTVTQCLKIDTYDSSVLSSNSVFTELSWKVDIANSCAEPFAVRVTFRLYDKDDFELDSDHEDVAVPANGVGKARGKMLVSPPEKARRMAKQGVALSDR